jgi:hypothetical protein
VDGTGNYRDVGAADNFQKAQGVGDLFVAPLVATDNGNAEDFDLRRLNENKESLKVAAAGTRSILVNDDLAALLGSGERAPQQREDR